uniref:glutathione peroxidase n=1 Tax=Cellvibrio fontiphilus TaxID=1815559 RepID=UPI002B4BC7EF|nr:glutathione peroxidase [Cellvibrio fontiphilus]
MSPFYTFSAESLAGEPVSLADYRDKLVLVVNTASQCGFTPQYAGLETLYQTYKDQGLVVLGFPCNQFGGQEPGDAADIANTCQLNYGVTFPMFAKVDVNGADAHPLFKWLVDAAPGLLGNAIKWNFTKFLINRQGEAIKRFAPITKPEALADEIQALLKT